MPKVSLPTVAAAAAIPSLGIPLAFGSSISQVSLPKIPNIKTPKISMPKVNLPSIAALPSLGIPQAFGSSISQVSLPKIDLPDFDLSGVSGTVSSGVDSIVGARDRAYDQGGVDIGSGNVAKGGTEIAGAAAADILLPLDLANVTNKALTGRMDEITGEDAVWAAVDAVSLLAIPFTGGASYALARAAKSGKVLSSSAKVGKSMSLVSGLKSAIKGIKGAPAMKSYSSLAHTVRTAPRTIRTYSSATNILKSPRKVVKKTSLLTGAKYSTKTGSSIKTYPAGLKASNPISASKGLDSGTALRSADGIHASKASDSLKVAESTSALGHTGQAATKSGLWWKVGAAGLGASVLGSFLMGDGADGTPEEPPVDPNVDPYGPGGYPGGFPAQEDLSDEEYISELEAYIAELENALAAGQITPEEYQELVGEAEAEMQDVAGEYFDSPLGEWVMPAEELAQDMTRATDGVPFIGDLLEWFRKHGLALPVLLVIGGGGGYLVLTKTKGGKKVLRTIKGKGRGRK